MKRTTSKQKGRQLTIDFGTLPTGAKTYIETAYRAKRAQKVRWKGMFAVPPGSLLETIIQDFNSHTNIALEIPFLTFMHYVSGALIMRETKIVFNGQEMDPEIWTIILAKSSAGKTWTERKLGAGLNDIVPVITTGAASAARWLQEFEQTPRGLWIRDEFYQLLKNIEMPGPLADLKDYLLRIYDNATIQRATKRDSIVVEHPVLSILGFTPIEPFVNGIQLESLVDGFAQRFGFVLSRPDPNRKMEDFAFWEVTEQSWRTSFEEMIRDILPRYEASEDGKMAFTRMFKSLAKNIAIEESFYRRIMWRAHKYALIYHVLRGATADPVINAEDYGWAERLIELQLADTADLIDLCSKTDIGKAIDAAELLIKRLREQGKPVTARAIVSGTRFISNVGMARLVLTILNIQEQ